MKRGGFRPSILMDRPLAVMLADRDIVCISGVAWDSYWLSLHQYMSRLARAHRVLFVNRPVVLPSAIAQRARRGAEDRAIVPGSVRHVDERLYVADPPPALPLRFERPVTIANQALRGSFVARVARDLGFESPVLWIHDLDASRVVERLDAWVSLYWVTDDHPTGPAFRANRTNRVAAMRARERELLRSVDLVLTTAPQLRDAKASFNSNSHCVPHGVDTNHFAQAANPETPPAPPFGAIRAPIIGFVGQINERLDRELVTLVARAHPEWSIVFVGPVLRDLDVGPLRALRNVHFLGPANLDRLPEFLKPMAVCTVPFIVNEHTRTMNPLKVLEYLAAGKPVVATPLPALRAYGSHIALASGPEEFAAAVEQALAEDCEARRRSRAEFAGRHSWESHLEEIWGLVEMTAALKGVATKDRDASRGGSRIPRTAGNSERPVGGAT
jgi:glycosyltransferase involved in cell wall biosynthesis